MMDLTAIIVASLAAVASITSSVFSFLGNRKAGQTRQDIFVLRDQTNHIKDALVRVTAESEHAKGVLMGRAEAAAQCRYPAEKE